MSAVPAVEVFHLSGQHDQQSHAGGGARRGGDRTGYPEVDAVIEDFLDEPLGDWTTSDKKVGDMEAVDCAGACDSVAEQFTEYATERGLKVYTTRTSVDEMGYEITGDPAGEILDVDGNIVAGFYQEHTVNQVYVDGQAWPLTIDFTARQYGYDTPVKTDPAVRDEDLAVEVFHLQGQHNQKDHGRRGGAGAPIEDLVGRYSRTPTHQGYFGEIEFGRYHGTEDSGVYSVTVKEHGTSEGTRSWDVDKFDVQITTDEDGNMIAAEVTRRVTRNELGNPEMAADDLNALFEEHGVALEWGEAVQGGRRVQTEADLIEEARAKRLGNARAAAYDTVYDAYNFSITDREGQEYFVSADPTVDDPSGGNAAGIITDWEGNIVGRFDRNVDLEFGRVDNDSFQVEPAWQGRGIGTAFLDRSEAALAEAGVERSRLTAVDVGRYAWMARGYQVSPTDRASVVKQWVPEVESILSSREFTDVQRSQARAVVRSWQAGDDVYGADLLSVSDEFADVFLNGPTYSASRELTPSFRPRAWVDPNQTELDLSVEVFHLQGQHDQKDHGRRGGARSGIDALDASDIPVMTDEYGELLISSTGVDRIRQIAYDYDGGSDVYDVVIVDNGDGTISVDVENLYGPDGTIEGEQALERYLNENGIDDVRWDGERGTLHASHRAAVMAGDATAAQELVVKVEDAYSGGFEVNGQTYVIGETQMYIREAPPILGEDVASVEIRGSIMEGDVTGKEVGQFSRAVYEDGTVYNHSLNIDRDFQGQGIGTAFLEETEGALEPEVIKLAAVNVGKYAWAARGYQLDTGNSSLAASTRDRWADSAREIIGRTVDPDVANRAEAVLRSWSDDLNSVYPADLLAVDADRFRDVFLEGPSWDAIKRRDDPLAAAAGTETFHLQGQHDQQTHAGERAPKPELVAGRFYPASAYPALTHEDDVYEASQMWSNPSAVGNAFDSSGNLPYVEMTRAADRAVAGREIRASREAAAGVGLLKGMPDAPLTTVPHYRGLGHQFDPERDIQALVSATPDLELATTEYGGGNGRGSLIRFEPGTPHREAFGGSWGQWEESIVSGRFEFTRVSPNDLTDDEMFATYNTTMGEQSPVWSARFVEYLDVPGDDAELALEVFHLKGQHDQQTHAGGRAKASAGIPEPSAEELEWRRMTREVPFLPNPAAGFESKRAVFRNDRWLLVHGEDGTAIRIEGGVKTSTQDRLDMVNALADAYDANPVTALDEWGDPIEPRIEILDEWDQGPSTVAYVMPGLDPAKYDIHSGVARGLGRRGREPYRILVNDNPEVWDEAALGQFRRDAMPEIANHSPRKYIITHEYGHVRMALGDDNRDEVKRIGGAVWRQGWMGMSEYGRSNQAESHAEAFAEWTLSGGQTSNQAARLYARDLRWPGAPAFSERIEDPLAASAGIDVDDFMREPVICGDSPQGAVLTFADGQVEQFAVEVFHLQGEHDQQSHAGGRGGEAPTPPTEEEFDEAADTVDPIPIYDRMGIDQTIMRAADFSEGEHDASWAHAAYTLGGSEAMNKYLRGQELPVHFQDDHATDAEILKQAIAEAEPTKHDLVVYRGLGRFPRGMEGERIQDNGFISTSLDRRVAETFGNVVEIRVPAGTRAIAGNWGEFEVILAPGTQFDVTEDGLDVV